MVTSEGNRAQVSTAPAYDRQAQGLQPAAEAAAQEPRAEGRVSLEIRDPFWFMSLVVAGATIGSIWGLGVVVLAILGLSGLMPVNMFAVAGIVLGFAFLTLGGVGATWTRMFGFTERDTRRDRTMFSSGVGAVSIAGIAAILLSILNLVFFANARFGAVAVLLLGVGLLCHSGVMRLVSRFTYYGVEGRRPTGPFAINAMSLAPLRDLVVGLGSMILGILAILNVAPVVLGLVASLVIGAALTLTVSTICGATLETLTRISREGQFPAPSA